MRHRLIVPGHFVSRRHLETDHELTLVIPAYNEERRLPRTLSAVQEFLDDWGIDYRVLVVDNGSQDNTGRLTDDFDNRFMTIPQLQSGKGAAVRKGMLHANGAVIAFTDADLPYDLHALRHAYELVANGQSDVVFGARDIDGASIATRRRWLRTVASSVFRGIVRRLVSGTITDTQCGLKVFSRDAANQVFSRATLNGFAFDAEVVFLARHLRLKHARVPVTLINEDGSTLSLARHALPMLIDVLRIRWQAAVGRYRTEVPELAPSNLAVAPQQRRAA